MSKLFEPITLRNLSIRNRIWLASMCQYSVEKHDGVPTDWHLVNLGARATGGFGLVMTEATAVVPEGRISPQDTGIWNDEQADAWARITDFVKSQGATPGIQLAHAGRKASTKRGFVGEDTGVVTEAEGGWVPDAPSALAFDGLIEPHALSREEIAGVVRAFADAAARAKRAGFQAAEIHAAHGYLIHEFLSPLSNQRTDEYGGSFENRIRLLLEVVDAVRPVWGEDLPLFARISATDWTDGGWMGEDSAQLAQVLKGHGVDLVDVSTGGNVLADIPVGPGYQLPLAEQVHGTGMPTGAVGLITEPQQAEQVLETGTADVVLLARAALREPAWPLRAAHELGVDWHDAPYAPQQTRGHWG